MKSEADELREIAEALRTTPPLPTQPKSSDGQTSLFETGRDLPRKQRRDFAQGQDFLFALGRDDV